MINIKLNGWGTLFSEPHTDDIFGFRYVWQPITMSLVPSRALDLAVELLTQLKEFEEAEKQRVREAGEEQ